MTTSGPIVGTPAPDFDLPCTAAPGSGRRRVTLADFRQRWLVLVFYPRDFSLVCPTELTALSTRIDEFHKNGAEVLGVSVDPLESHEKWLSTPRARGGLGEINFPLASDVDGAVSRAYGVFLEQQHMALRGLFVIDPNGVLQFQSVHNLALGRRTDDVLRVVSALQTGGLCAEDWTPGQAPIDPHATLTPGRMVGHYRIEEFLGSGSCGSVFRAHDTTLDRTVALKVLTADSPLQAGDMIAEARSAAALNHPNICTVYAVDDSEGVPLIAMEYVPGRPLSGLIDGVAMSLQRTTSIGGQVASAMAAAHTAGICHGDLKPANILIRDDEVVKVVDFGLARREIDPEATVVGSGSGRLRGTPAYMSPEQARGGPATSASDVFSLGLILYESLKGQPAAHGDTIGALLEEILTLQPKRLAAEVPEPFAAILGGALVSEPVRRITMDRITEMLGKTVP